jgi:hypothetical protein
MLTHKRIEYFDYQGIAKELKMSATALRKVEKEVEREFPDDKMMFELHVLRAVRSGYWKQTDSMRVNRRIRGTMKLGANRV